MVANRQETSAELSELWFVDPARLNAVTVENEGIVTEENSAGQYADIPAEQVGPLLEALAARPWREVLKQFYETQNPWLYRIVTDPARVMSLELLDLRGGSRCLDVGSGWGQFSIPMAQLGCKVVALDLTLERLRVLKRIAAQEGTGLELVKGNILSFPFREGVFDLVLFNGALEWVGMGRKEGQTIRELQVMALKNAGRAVRAGGHICVAIENSLGLKYLMGARDDHTSLAGYSFLSEAEATAVMRKAGGDRTPTKTWGLAELEKIFKEAGLGVQSVYGCFPDYKLPRHLIPLAEVNQFILQWPMDWMEHHGDKGEPMMDSGGIHSAYRQFAENGIAQWVCPSYFMVLVKS